MYIYICIYDPYIYDLTMYVYIYMWIFPEKKTTKQKPHQTRATSVPPDSSLLLVVQRNQRRTAPEDRLQTRR